MTSARDTGHDAPPQPELRLDWDALTALRGLCALFVVVSHVWFQIWPAAVPPLGYGRAPSGALGAFTGWLYNGHLAVVVFIVVSGFSLEAARLRRAAPLKIAPFLRRRARRILPAYYAALALSLLVALTLGSARTGSQWDISLPVTVRGVVAHVLLLQDVIDSTQVNYALWSIAAEVHLYLIFPVVAALLSGWGVTRTAVSAAVLVGGLMIVLAVTTTFPVSYLGLVLHFVIGAGAADVILRLEPRASRSRFWWGTVGILLVLTTCALIGPRNTDRVQPIADVLVAVATVLLISGVVLRVETPPHRYRRLRRVLVALGAFSYSTYLIHPPVVHLSWLVTRELSDAPGNQFLVLLGVAVPLSLIAGRLLFMLVERRTLTIRPRAVPVTSAPRAEVTAPHREEATPDGLER
ncbi:acyltransferase family protein [Cellulomonas hominis]|uniref:acyltransferase family protein n=1 Tax=Cellulomonas hominis TaxID=156981 RepID=UPI001B99B3FA|nr:acyltransferase [Cellulomonas hominis]VTR75990.1 hypothetical protein CHMI_00746 [Cellulomonas hominis]